MDIPRPTAQYDSHIAAVTAARRTTHAHDESHARTAVQGGEARERRRRRNARAVAVAVAALDLLRIASNVRARRFSRG